MKAKLLILDDDRAILDLLRRLFDSTDMDVFTETSDEEALRIIAEERPNVAIVDLNLQEKSGLDVLREAKKIDPGLAVIIATGARTTHTAIEAMKDGAYDYLTKPFDLFKLKGIVQKALECNLLNRAVRFTRERERVVKDDSYDDVMIGSSPEMLEIWKMVGKVADSDATVLIQGESGTGKELLARAIYNYSRRKNRPFLAVNCAALPETLLESELFGHEKGAFTDAHSRRIGKFEQCNGGTIFLDEIAEMSLANQGKLLRVLECQEFERVGGNETLKVDVRVVTAANKSLIQAVKEKRFRLDLFYRLRVVSLFLPPLRERVEDIPLLADLFIRKYADQYGKQVMGIAPQTLEILKSNHWEGNVRELKNLINSAVVLCKGDMLTPEDFETLVQPKTVVRKGESSVVGGDYYAFFWNMLESEFDGICRESGGAVYERVSGGLEKVIIQMAMKKSQNNQVMAATLLGISRNTLRDRLERFKICTEATSPRKRPR